MTDDGHQVMAKAHIAFGKNIKMLIPTCNVQNKHVTLYQHQLISKGDNGKSYLSFNSLGKSYLTFNSEDFLEINQSETKISCGGHVC